MRFVEVSWPRFCEWLQGKRVASTVEDGAVVTLEFEDGSFAEMESRKTDGYPGYSEVTPGSDGHLEVPLVRVLQEGD